MIVHQVYALISDNIVQNVCVCDNYEMANYIARASYGDEAFAVDCLQYPCGVGFSYHDGNFYYVDAETREETQVEYVPTQEEQVFMLQIEADKAKEELTNTQLALVESYEENLVLKDEITMTQLALVEIYEGGIA